VSLTVPSSVTLEGPDYLGTCIPDNTTDGCQSVSYSSSAEKLTLTWTGIVTPGQTFYTKVVYQAAAQVGSLPPGQLVETISDTDPTDIGTADKTSIIQAGTAAGTGTTTTGGGTTPTGTTPTGTTPTGTTPTGTTPTGTTMGGGAAPTGTIPTVVTSAVVCVAPSLMRMTLARAKLTLRAAHCGLGNVDQRKHRARHHVLRVIGQSVRVGSRHPRGYLIRIRLA
jgi:hypothetical protein